jgi:hypothetical protein
MVSMIEAGAETVYRDKSERRWKTPLYDEGFSLY